MNMQYLPEKIFKSGFSFLKKTVAVSLIFFTSVLSAESYTLETLTENLLKNNPDIRTAQEEYNRSVLDYKDALGGMGPKIDLQISATYMVNPPVGSLSVNVDDILNAVSWPSGTKPTQTGRYVKIYDGMENTYYNFGLTLTQPLWTWGKLHNAAKLYKEVSNIQEIKLEYTEQKLKTELETRIITLMFLNKINEILEEEKILAEELVSYSEDAEKSGMLLHQDVVDARIQAKELDIAKQGVSEQITNQILELQRITGIEELSFEQIDYSF
ncbi:MAG: TolC family protein, partial [Treponema sp.]|nr:TolC family protein [Treponema sp.]